MITAMPRLRDSLIPFWERLANPIQTTLNPLDHVKKKWARQIKRFKSKVHLEMYGTVYSIRTARSPEDLEAALRLRHRVFYEELLNQTHSLGWDIDSFDMLSDHVCVFENATGKLVGTYRTLLSTLTHRFYSESEFDLTPFKRLPGIKMELGRACIDPDHRNGMVLSLLWAGIYRLALQTRADWVFGCSSVPTTNPFTAAAFSRYFQVGQVLWEGAPISPHDSHRLKGFKTAFQELSRFEGMDLLGVRKQLPPLLLSYFKAGAKVALVPAFDPAFRCVNYLTVLDIKNLNARTLKRFGTM